MGAEVPRVIVVAPPARKYRTLGGSTARSAAVKNFCRGGSGSTAPLEGHTLRRRATSSCSSTVAHHGSTVSQERTRTQERKRRKSKNNLRRNTNQQRGEHKQRLKHGKENRKPHDIEDQLRDTTSPRKGGGRSHLCLSQLVWHREELSLGP